MLARRLNRRYSPADYGRVSRAPRNLRANLLLLVILAAIRVTAATV